MTLGGIALAVGILVDDATVEIENIHRNLAQGKAITQAILDGAAQIAVPAFVSTLCDLHRLRADVLPDRRRALPLRAAGEAVVFAMLASYFLSRTLVPTMARYLLRGTRARRRARRAPERSSGGCSAASRRASSGCARATAACSKLVMTRPARLRRVFLAFCVGSAALLLPWLGRDFFPSVDSGQIKLHVRAPDRNAHRGDRASLRPDRRRDPRGDPARRARDDHRQHRRCRTAASTSPTATPRRSGPPTPTSSSTMKERHRPAREVTRAAPRAS